MKSSTTNKLILGGILVSAAALRFWHISWGLPELYEEAYPYKVAWNLWNWGKAGFDLNPHFFNYPGLMIYLNFVVQAVHYITGMLTGQYGSLLAFEESYFANPTSHIILSRILSALFDIGTVWMLWMLGKTVGGARVAILAAGLAAINPLLIGQAHLITVDTPLAFFTVASLYCVLRASGESGSRWYYLAGIAIGLAASSKYTGALLLLVLLLAHLFLSDEAGAPFLKRLFDTRLLVAVAIAIGVFLLWNPYIVLSPREFFRDFGGEEYHMGAGHLGANPGMSTTIYYLVFELPKALGWVWYLVAIGAIAGMAVARKRKDLLLISFPVLYMLIICTWQMRADRYLLPVIPVLILLGAMGVVWLREKARRFEMKHRIRTAAFAIGVIILIIQPAASVWGYHAALELPDTRTLATQWIGDNLPKGSAVAMTPIQLPMPNPYYRVVTIPFFPVDPQRIAMFFDSRWYVDFDLLVGSDFDRSRFEQDSVRYAAFMQFYKDLQTRWDMAAEILPEDNQQSPAIWLYRPPDSVCTTYFDNSLLTSLQQSRDTGKVRSFLRVMIDVLYKKQRFAKAEQLNRWLLQWDETPGVHRSLAITLSREDKNDEAMKEIQGYLQDVPNDADMVNFEGSLYMKAKLLDDAEPLLKKALSMNPKLFEAYENLYLVYSTRHDQAAAIDILMKYAALLPPNGDKFKLVAGMLDDLRHGKFPQ